MKNTEINKEWFLSNQQNFNKLAEKVDNIIAEILTEKCIEYHQVTYRCKTLESFSKKIEKSKYVSISEITDIAGIRVITYVEDSIPLICKIIEENFDIDWENSSDKSEQLGVDKVGYKSVHYVAKLPDSRLELTEYKKYSDLKFEIQIRTILQHSWAEIEHDRNYKFGGVLPTNIQRRFKLLAGLLELADNEFNTISLEIDKYTEEVKNKTLAGDLDIAINSTSLQQFMNQYTELIQDMFSQGEYNFSDEIIKELNDYGLFTLSEFNSIIPSDLIEKYKKLNLDLTPVGVIRDILIINDSEKYFNKSFKRNWYLTGEHEDIAIFEEYKLDIGKFIS